MKLEFNAANITKLVITAVGAVATQLSDVLQAYWSAHPQASTLAMFAYATLALFLQSPVRPSPAPPKLPLPPPADGDTQP